MARLTRLCLPGIPQHIIQRGNNRQPCFSSDEDIAAYANWLLQAANRYKVHIHAWAFMTNHVHLLATPQEELAVSKMMQFVGRHYVRYFNHTYHRTGTLWEGRFKSCLVQEEEYLFNCYRYIELNPVRANMVNHPMDYRWSSYQANALGVESRLRQPHPLYLGLGKTASEREAHYRGLFEAHVNDRVINDIRTATNKGLVLGNEIFKDEVAELTGRRVRLQKRGPKTDN
jgi:putative transposase